MRPSEIKEKIREHQAAIAELEEKYEELDPSALKLDHLIQALSDYSPVIQSYLAEARRNLLLAQEISTKTGVPFRFGFPTEDPDQKAYRWYTPAKWRDLDAGLGEDAERIAYDILGSYPWEEESIRDDDWQYWRTSSLTC